MGNKKEIAESRIPELNNYMKVSQFWNFVNVLGCILVMLYWWELCLLIVALMCFGGCNLCNANSTVLNYQEKKKKKKQFPFSLLLFCAYPKSLYVSLTCQFWFNFKVISSTLGTFDPVDFRINTLFTLFVYTVQYIYMHDRWITSFVPYSESYGNSLHSVAFVISNNILSIIAFITGFKYDIHLKQTWLISFQGKPSYYTCHITLSLSLL